LFYANLCEVQQHSNKANKETYNNQAM